MFACVREERNVIFVGLCDRKRDGERLRMVNFLRNRNDCDQRSSFEFGSIVIV